MYGLHVPAPSDFFPVFQYAIPIEFSVDRRIRDKRMGLYRKGKGFGKNWTIAAAGFFLSPYLLLADDVPVAPIRTQVYGDLAGVYVLKNERVEVVIDPSVGRVVSLKHIGKNKFGLT